MSKDFVIDLYGRIKEALNTENPAEIARNLGIERQSVYKWRDGKNSPDLERLIEIARVTNRSLDWLLTGKTEGEQNQDQGFRDSLFYKLYVACQNADPEKVRFVEQFMNIALEELQNKPNKQVLVKKKSRPK